MIKRMFDIILASMFIILLFPFIFIIIILVKIYHGSPILFIQERPGYRDKLFKMYKFRTMTNKKDAKGELLPDEERLTKFGKYLRSTSLDELPEMINVIKGDMSLVGPRPLLVEYLHLYSQEQRRRHEVKPGITGWAQINGRNAISWEEKFKYDVWYVDNKSFWLDIKIILITLKKVLFRKDINQVGQATAEAFVGSCDNNK